MVKIYNLKTEQKIPVTESSMQHHVLTVQRQPQIQIKQHLIRIEIGNISIRS